MDVHIEEETHQVAALSVQGPTSYSVLSAAGLTGLEQLKTLWYSSVLIKWL